MELIRLAVRTVADLSRWSGQASLDIGGLAWPRKSNIGLEPDLADTSRAHGP
jgi:hypothetical protein